MKRQMMAGLSLVICSILLTFPALAQGGAELKTKKDKTSYSIGVDIGKNLKLTETDFDLDILIKGLQDQYLGKKLVIPDADLQKTMQEFYADLKEKQTQALKKLAETNKKAGDAFLAENKKKDGVQCLPSGLQYKIIKNGEGKKPTATDTVEVRYRGTLIDGTEFEKTEPGGKPVSLKVGAVIPGWKEALQLMPPGSKWQLFIPASLAYGERGAGRVIGPNATLVFELEVTGIK